MNISPNVLGILRSLAVMVGWTVITVVLNFLMNPVNLAGLSPLVSAVIVMIASGIDHAIEAKTGKALFGAVRQKAS
jgi:hypothetical protein